MRQITQKLKLKTFLFFALITACEYSLAHFNAYLLFLIAEIWKMSYYRQHQCRHLLPLRHHQPGLSSFQFPKDLFSS